MSCNLRFETRESDELPRYRVNNRKGPHQCELASLVESAIVDWADSGTKRYLVLSADEDKDVLRLYQTVANVVNSMHFKRRMGGAPFRCAKRGHEIYVYKEERGRGYVPRHH